MDVRSWLQLGWPCMSHTICMHVCVCVCVHVQATGAQVQCFLTPYMCTHASRACVVRGARVCGMHAHTHNRGALVARGHRLAEKHLPTCMCLSTPGTASRRQPRPTPPTHTAPSSTPVHERHRRRRLKDAVRGCHRAVAGHATTRSGHQGHFCFGCDMHCCHWLAPLMRRNMGAPPCAQPQHRAGQRPAEGASQHVPLHPIIHAMATATCMKACTAASDDGYPLGPRGHPCHWPRARNRKILVNSSTSHGCGALRVSMYAPRCMHYHQPARRQYQ